MPLGIMPILCDYPHAAEVGFSNLIVPSWNQNEKRFNRAPARRRFTLRFEHLTAEEADALWYHYLAQRGSLHSFTYYDYLSEEPFTVRYIGDTAKRETYLHEVEMIGVQLLEVDATEPVISELPVGVRMPWERWDGGYGYYSDQAGTVAVSAAASQVRGWRGRDQGLLAYWDNAAFGASPPVIAASLDRLTMGVYGGMEYNPAALFVSGVRPFSIMARAKPTGAMNQTRCWGGFGADGATPHHLIYTDVVTSGSSWIAWQHERRGDGGTQVQGFSPNGVMTPTAGTEYRRWYLFDGTFAYDYLNGTLLSVTDLSAAGVMTTSLMFIGTDSSGAIQDGFIGDYEKWWVFDHVASQDTRDYWDIAA